MAVVHDGRVHLLAWCAGVGLSLTACGHRAAGDRTAPPNERPRDASGDSAATAARLRAIVEAADRDADDREADTRRKPFELLTFLGLEVGAKVADLGAGFGYTTELLARTVGPTGTVLGQNPKFVLDRFAQAGWTARLAKPINANVVRLDREFVDPFPADVRDLDMVVNVLFYHDFEWMGVDRAAHNLAVRNALRTGGHYVLVDAHAKAGAGTSASKTLHRIEESIVIDELEAAGFELVDRGDFLRNPNDSRDWNALPWQNDRGEFSDKFALKFRKTGPVTPTRCSLEQAPGATRTTDWVEAWTLLGGRALEPPAVLTADSARARACAEGGCVAGQPWAVVVSDDPDHPTWVSGGFVFADHGALRVWGARVGDFREYHCTPQTQTESGRVGAFDHARLTLLQHVVIGGASDGNTCEVDVDQDCMIGCFYDEQHEIDLLHDPRSGLVTLVEATTPLDAAVAGVPALAITPEGAGVRIDGCSGGPLHVGR